MAEKESPRSSLAASGLFMELASETRLSIMMKLKENPAKLSTLARFYDTSVQDIFRNSSRLLKEGLVKKDSNGLFYLTSYGNMILNQVPYFIFLKRHRKFFEEHSLENSSIPLKFLRRIGELEECEVVESVTLVLQKLKKLESSAKNTLKVLVSQAWPEEGLIFIDRAQQGAEVIAIAGHNMIIPKNVVSDIGPKFDKLMAEGIFKCRMLQEVRVALYISDDKQAGIMFPDTHGEVDMRTLFTSKNPEFCTWCLDLFAYFHSRSKPFDLSKMNVAD